MRKNAFILFLVFVILLPGQPAKADKLFQMGNGFEIRLSEEWQQSTNMLVRGSRAIFFASLDASGIGTDLDSVDQTSYAKTLTESMGIKTENYRSYDPLNGFHTTIMDMEMSPGGITISGMGALIILHPFICILFYFSEDANDIITEDDIIDLVYRISVNASNQSAAEKALNAQTENGVYLSKTPLLVGLDEEAYDYVYSGMPEDSATLKRISYSYDQIMQYLTMGEGTDMIIWRTGTDGLFNNQAPSVKIRIKENRVRDNADARIALPYELKLTWDELISSFRSDGEYTTETINGIPYAAFTFPIGFQKRYVTILNGDLIYVFLESPDELTEDDLNLLHNVLEGITVAE